MEGGAILRFAKVRAVGDTLYGWDFANGEASQDSVALPLGQIRALKQEHLDVEASLQTVVFSFAAVCVLFVTALGVCRYTQCLPSK